MRYLILSCLLLAACGDGTVIERHHVSQEEINVMAGGSGYYGYAKWDNIKCDIYVLEPNQYVKRFIVAYDKELGENVRVTYTYAVGHETRHCFGDTPDQL